MPAESLSAAPTSTPQEFEVRQSERRVWLVIGDRRGDNTQVHIIANSLGWRFDIKQAICSESYLHRKTRFRSSFDHLDKAGSDPLVEVARLGKLLAIFALPSQVKTFDSVARRASGVDHK